MSRSKGNTATRSAANTGNDRDTQEKSMSEAINQVPAVPQQVAAHAALQLGWKSLSVEIGKKEETGLLNADGTKEQKVKKIGTVIIPIPTFEAFDIPADVDMTAENDNEQKGIDNDGLPIYADKRFQWLFQAAVAQAKVQARNKLVNGTADLKDGMAIAANFDELTAEAGTGEALKRARECLKAFAAYLGTLNKTPATVAYLLSMFRNKEALSTQDGGMKGKIAGYIDGFSDGLEDADLTRYSTILARIQEACKPAAELSDL